MSDAPSGPRPNPGLNPRGDDPATPLSEPLHRVLRDPVDESRVPVLWRGIEARRGRLQTPVRTALVWASLGALIGVLVMIAVELGAGGRILEKEAPTARVIPPAAALTLRDGVPLGAIDAPAGASRSLAFSDGSSAELAAGSRIEPLAASAREVILRLARGSSRFEVQPGGPRRWIVEAGLASVEVVGTRFEVHRTEASVKVSVERGVVLVRARTLPDGVVRLEAGEVVEIRAPEVVAAPPASASPPSSSPGAPAPAAPPAARRASVDPWRGHAARGAYSDAYAALGPEGVELEASRLESPDDLLTLADVARLSGHPRLAVAPLERLLAVHASSPAAPLAAVTLGRIELGSGNAARAAVVLERALALGPPAALVEDVHARLVEALVKAGDVSRARAAGDRYLRAFPEGRRRADVERWLPR